MLTEMAKMSCEDGLVMQIHSGSRRNHSKEIFYQFGLDKGFDIPGLTDYVSALKPLLDEVGLNTQLTIILFTLDESAYSRNWRQWLEFIQLLNLGLLVALIARRHEAFSSKHNGDLWIL